MKKLLLPLIFSLLSILPATAQFNIDAYKQYLKSHQDMTVDELLQEYPAGYFREKAPTNLFSAEYGDNINTILALTDYEKELIANHGFMVTERLTYNTFQDAFQNIYNKDLPVYISSDAILHALHYSYDDILKDIEENSLLLILDRILSLLYKRTSVLSSTLDTSVYGLALKDMDLYLNIAIKLLRENTTYLKPEPVFPENKTKINNILVYINNLQPQRICLFAKQERDIDFSQFKPRGHYTKSEELKNYFKCMIWLGRTEILINNPKQSELPPYSDEDLQRQCILSALLAESARKTDAISLLKIMENVLTVLIGRQDNIDIFEVDSVMQLLNITSAYELIQTVRWKSFQSELLKLKSAAQLYNSQILYSDPYTLEQIEPPAAFLLMGQRPILDGFITGNVVYDKIIYKGGKVLRMLPSTLDILFSIGNDAAIQLLEPELRVYPYSMNLAALRYLVSSYNSDFWNSTCYNNWLSAIKGLNPPQDRSNLPKFMQTAAWWQKTMNTQLASWSQLRHDYILYAKQPYTANVDTCGYPYGFVEPVPETFKAISLFAQKAKTVLNEIPAEYMSNSYCFDIIKKLFDNFIEDCDKLASISSKELNNESLTPSDISFMQSLYNLTPNPNHGMCGSPYYFLDGWYFDLFYEGLMNNGVINEGCNYTVADVHTAPTDADGNLVGWVLHGGTGKINMAVIVTKNSEGKDCAFAGPVMSYYETVTEDFFRYSDEEWEDNFKTGNPQRHPLTNLYLAGAEGEERFNKISLFTSVEELPGEPDSKIFVSNFPNPFDNFTRIKFNVPPALSNKNAELSIYTVDGKLIKKLIEENLPLGNYSIMWDGTDYSGNCVNSGIYIYTVTIGEFKETGKMTVVR